MTKDKFVTERTRIISEMLDNPDSYGIYPTTKCFNELDDLFDKITSDNSDYAKLPTIEECYQAIPFPSSEPDCAMFVAGIADCHKFVSRYFA